MHLEARERQEIEHAFLPFIFAIFSFLWAINYLGGPLINDFNYVRSFSYGQGASNQITVVYLDDEFLDDLRDRQFQEREFIGWPLSYKIQAMLYGRIASFHPKAIFLDFIYANQNQPDSELSYLTNGFFDKAAHAGSDGHAVPVFLSAVEETVQDNKSEYKQIVKPIPALASKGEALLAAWDYVPDHYPLAIEIGEGRYKKTYNSAAYGLYQMACGTHCAIPMQMSTETNQAMAVQWPHRNTRYLVHSKRNIYEMTQNGIPSSPGCHVPDNLNTISSTASIIKNLAGHFLIEKVFNWIGMYHEEHNFCPPVDTVHASVFFDPHPAQHGDEISPLIKDRIILVGASLSGARDLIETPTHGKQPGVYLHAMALDNLLTLGDNYYRDSIYQDNVNILTLLILHIVIISIGHHYRWKAIIAINHPEIVDMAADATSMNIKDVAYAKYIYEQEVTTQELKAFKLYLVLAFLASLIIYLIHKHMHFTGMLVVLFSYSLASLSLVPKSFKNLIVHATHLLFKSLGK